MATRAELNKYYRSIYHKDFPSSTLSKWVAEGQIKATKQGQLYNYDLDSFIQKIQSNEYQTQIRARKEKPEDYIGKTCGKLLITGIVPEEEKKEKYNGTLMYCDCLACGKKNFQVRFSYLTKNGNYTQQTCGCYRRIRAFLATSRDGITLSFVEQFASNFDDFLFIHKMLSHILSGYYRHCPIKEYENAILYFMHDKQFWAVYNFWKEHKNEVSTFYDLAKPSIDHKIPVSKGGSDQLENIQVLTLFENLAKRDMTWEEWQKFKKDTHSSSDYYLESILQNQNKESGVLPNNE